MNPDNYARINALAAIAKNITALPVAEQYEILAKEGLTLNDINWEVVYDPKNQGLQNSVTIIPVVEPVGK